ncbi:hypothetical protein PFDG_05533 [Plasmodium falciparum Dd2]|uniref:Uncharacterized protein n=1 Tax=Plasmodium falciparum (isolate Dd2) TaxID=57267 RepID=A0A0L7M7G4_PLAF4|nr:hypothetical protein PFDG_05533 [Plasmodium falciparum Dd2]
MKLFMKKGHNLSRKEIRKLARKQIKKNKLLYSKKKRKNSFLKKEHLTRSPSQIMIKL